MFELIYNDLKLKILLFSLQKEVFMACLSQAAFSLLTTRGRLLWLYRRSKEHSIDLPLIVSCVSE